MSGHMQVIDQSTSPPFSPHSARLHYVSPHRTSAQQSVQAEIAEECLMILVADAVLEEVGNVVQIPAAEVVAGSGIVFDAMQADNPDEQLYHSSPDVHHADVVASKHGLLEADDL